MKRTLLASAACAGLACPGSAEPVNIGVILDFTGPLRSITPRMAASADLAFREASEAGALPAGITLNPVHADSASVVPAATSAAEELVTARNVAAILGGDDSDVATAIATSVAVPGDVVMVSPSATSPTLSTLEDNGYFFRTAPSDARQGVILADLVTESGVTEVAVTHTSNDYGKGLADSFAAAFQQRGGTVAISVAHEDGEANYAAEVAALRASGARTLMVFGYVDLGGRGIVRAALSTAAFERFYVGDGMYGQGLIDAVGSEINGKVVGILPGFGGEGADAFAALATANGIDPTGAHVPESYDAGALIALAIAAAGSADRTGIRDHLTGVANAPGERINAGELAKGIEILTAGGDIDYQGATGVELIGSGEAVGAYRVYEIKDDGFATLGYR